jgi:peptidyl-prolyl cis-trans isomerase C
MKKLILSSLVTLTFSSLAFANGTYGTVNGQQITKEDINKVIRNPKVNFDTLPAETQKKVIDQVIDTKLLSQNALKSGIKNEKSFKDALKKLEAELALEIWMQKKSKEIKISEKEMKDFYSKNKDKFTQKAILKARHILVANEKDAKDIISQLSKSKNLKNDFIKLAQEKSTGPSGKNGGDLGWFEPKQMVPEFSKAASALKKGTFTKKAVKTQFGYHVIFLEDKKDEGVASYDDAKLKLQQVLAQEKFLQSVRSVVKDLRNKATIKTK